MFFEASEKKFELIIHLSEKSLLDLDNSFWHEVVHACNASILSEINNKYVKAFLLSESSLFVWHDRVVMITCGTTVLANAILKLIQLIDSEVIKSLIYQRKNEYNSRGQITSFMDDISELRNVFMGSSIRVGNLDEHHNFIFSFENNYQSDINDETLEVLLYHICPEVSHYFMNGNYSSEEIRGVLKLDEFFPDFIFDDFVFDPCGYSLNGINGSDYMTIHITPEESISYVSLETNLGSRFMKNLFSFVNIFMPKSFDIISFNNSVSNYKYDDYLLIQNTNYQLDSGYDIYFSQYTRINLSNQKVHLLT